MKRQLKYIAIALASIMIPSGALAEKRSNTQGTPAIEFTTPTTHDFGTVRADGGRLTHTFKFKNSGTAPLSIVTVSASCGCTKPEFNAKPIAPGDSSEITLRFNPEEFRGEFEKTATVRTNIKGRAGRAVLTLKGVIIPKK